MRISDERQFFEVKIDIGKISIISCPAFCDRRNNRAQGLAALHSSRMLFLFRWFGMKRTRTLRFADGSCDRAKRTMIGNCQPRTNGNRNGCGSPEIPLHRRFHARLQLAKACGVNRPRVANAQMFSSVSMIGPMAGGITSGGMASPEPSGVGLTWPNCGCSTRVAISIAMKSNAAAR
jgi:hypothetical protein